MDRFNEGVPAKDRATHTFGLRIVMKVRAIVSFEEVIGQRAYRRPSTPGLSHPMGEPRKSATHEKLMGLLSRVYRDKPCTFSLIHRDRDHCGLLFQRHAYKDGQLPERQRQVLQTKTLALPLQPHP